MKKHLSKCAKYENSEVNRPDLKQSELTLKATSSGLTDLKSWKYEDVASRRALTEMIIACELPFRIVEHEKFKKFCYALQARFHVPSRFTIAHDCYEVFVDERSKLKNWMKSNCRSICITIDGWTSIQNLSYMVITGHFIDNEWKLHKKILNFCPVTSHKDRAAAIAIEQCLREWGIEKVTAITVDNASSNDVCVKMLKDSLTKHTFILKGEYLHVRCVAHILNLIVKDGLKLVSESVDRIREAVKYVRQSPSRLRDFKMCVEHEKIDCKALLCLDVSTRWNSTVKMLHVAQMYERAFDKFAMVDNNFISTMIRGPGKPNKRDMANVRILVDLLKTFEELTRSVSASHYTTSNTYVHSISDVCFSLQEWSCDGNAKDDFREMRISMKAKWDKYWGDPEKLNVMIFLGVVFDPRYKLRYLNITVKDKYSHDIAQKIIRKLRGCLNSMFEEYLSQYNVSPTRDGNRGSDDRRGKSSNVAGEEDRNIKGLKKFQLRFMSLINENDEVNQTELEKYLKEGLENVNKDLDIYYGGRKIALGFRLSRLWHATF